MDNYRIPAWVPLWFSSSHCPAARRKLRGLALRFESGLGVGSNPGSARERPGVVASRSAAARTGGRGLPRTPARSRQDVRPSEMAGPNWTLSLDLALARCMRRVASPSAIYVRRARRIHGVASWYHIGGLSHPQLQAVGSAGGGRGSLGQATRLDTDCQ